MSREEVRQPTQYYTIISGTFRTQVPQDDPRALRREWKSSDGRTGVKYERIVNALVGYINDIQFYDGEFGLEVSILLDPGPDGKTPKITMNVSSREGESLLKRLPGIDFTKEVRLRPYSFNDNDGDEVKGIEIVQPDERGEFTVKVKDFFWDEQAQTKLHGYPVPEGNKDNYTTDDWKIYYIQVRRFLIEYTKTNVLGRLAVTERPAAKPSSVDYPEYEPNPEDLPF